MYQCIRHAIAILVVTGLLFGAGLVGGAGSAAAKEGAMFNPQLLTIERGQPVRRELWVMPVLRGRRVVEPAPPPGTVPVVLLHLELPRRVLRFRASPIGAGSSSSVRIDVPARIPAQPWQVTVLAGGRLYPDTIDLGEIEAASPPAAQAPPAAQTPRTSPPAPDLRALAAIGEVFGFW